MTRPQTFGSVLGLMLFSMLVWMAGPVVTGSSAFEWSRAAEGMLTGASFAIFITALDYARLPAEKRLTPPHAIGLGGFSLALVAWMVIAGGGPFTVVRAFGVLLMASPGIYLIVNGTRRLNAAATDSAPPA